MKKILYIISVVALLVGCNKEELPDTPDATRSQMSISVTDGGYTSGEKSHTRASENGYITEFTAGDQIGLYIVKSDGKYAEQNVCLTLTDVGNGILAWQSPVGTTLYHEGGTGTKYFAYYPYQQTLSGALEPSAATAAGFFSGVVSAWTPTSNQSTYALYTSSDLMTGIGTLDGKQADGTVSLSFTMAHAMALMVIETPSTKYSLSTDANYTWTTEAPDTKFYDFTPYSTSVGVYRYLVKPAKSGATDLMGSYTGANGNTKEYTLTQNNLIAAQYALYKVDGGSATVIEKSHTLQVGDFFMKDGSLVGKDEELTAAQKAACAGIVYVVNADGKGGKVVSLKEGTGRWGAMDVDESIDVEGITSTTDGATATKNLIIARKNETDFATNYYAFNWIYNTINGGDIDGRWYIPAKDELVALYTAYNGSSSSTADDAVRTAFNNKLTICGGTAFSGNFYRSATQYNSDNSWYVHFDDGLTNVSYKDYSYSRVRCISAF